MERHGGELLVDTLIGHGVSHVFGMPGGQANGLYDAIANRQEKIKHILIRDETTAGYSADAYAGLTGTIGVCDATVGPGSMKFPSGLMEAYNSSVPILVLISDHPKNAALLQQYGRISQGGDQLNVLKPFAKETFDVPSVDMLPKVVAAAIHTAITGRPGPVVVQIAQNIYEAKSTVEPMSGTSEFPKYRCVPPQSEVDRAIALLQTAKRPFVLAGGGVQLSQAYEELSKLIASYRVPLATTLSGKGSLRENDPLCLGVLGDLGSPCARVVAEQADVIVAIGYKHSQNSSNRWTWPLAHQKLIHIDIDPAEFGRVIQADVGLWGDAKEALKVLLAGLEKSSFKVSQEWVDTAIAAKQEWLAQRGQEYASTRVPIWPQSAISKISGVLEEDDVIICDAGFSSGWAGGFMELTGQGRQMILPRGAAGLGYSVSAAVGAAMARPNSRIISLSGDGAFSYNVGELATLKELNLPIINIIFNNAVLSWSKWTQQLNFSGNNQSVELGSFAFGTIARGFGIAGEDVANIEDLLPVLQREWSHRRPSVINIYTDEWQAPTMPYRKAMEKVKRGLAASQAY